MPNINNQNSINISKANKFHSAQKEHEQMENEVSEMTAQEIENLNNDYSAVIGRSQVNFKGDNFNNDMKIFMENPEAVNKANMMFDIAYAQQQKIENKNAYESAANISKEYYNEFHS